MMWLEEPRMDVEVRTATPGDVDALGVIHVAAWRTAYRGMMPDAYLDGLDTAARSAMWAQFFEARPTDRELRVVVNDGAVVGFACFGCCRDAESPSDAELHAINLHPDAWGRGLGRLLLADVTDRLSAYGSTAVLWVVTGNTRARGLYESSGWFDDGVSREAEVLGARVPEVRYRRPL